MNEDRSQFLGSSDIAAVLGLSPWATAVDVWEEKTGQGAPDAPDSDREKRLRRGTRLEPVIIEMAQEELDLWVANRNTRAFHHVYPYLSCQLDFEYHPAGLKITSDSDPHMDTLWLGNGECKSIDPRAADQWGESGSQDVPAYYMAQVMYGLAVTGRQQAMMIPLIGDDLRWYKFKRDEELCEALIEKAVEFWQKHVVAGVPPPAQTKDDASRLVRRFQGFSFEASDELLLDFGQLKLVKQQIKALEAEEKVLEMALLNRTLIAAEVLLPGEEQSAPEKIQAVYGGRNLFTWNLQKRAGYTVQPTEFRVLRLGKG